MRTHPPRQIAILVALALAACGPRARNRVATPPGNGHHHEISLETAAAGAKLFDDLGNYHRAITTSSADAQAYFDQGLRLYYGFNHDEAFRSFAKAAKLDPRCALCLWGASLSLGPNYNMPMFAERARVAWEARERAVALAPSASPVERALIGALAVRYAGPTLTDAAAQDRVNRAYAAEMRKVAAMFADDADVQVLFAEALMDVNPWKLYAADGTPSAETPEIVTTLEATLAHHPEHPGANHFYIHAIEASNDPGRAVAAADRLGAMMPGAGHLVHMPSHIYARVGRYEDAADANRRAVAADQKYSKTIEAPAHYLGMYGSHNHQFLSYTALVQGHCREAVASAIAGAGLVTDDTIAAMPWMEFFTAQPVVIMVRCGRYDDALAVAAPAPANKVATGLWHHARVLALIARGRVDEAIAERTALAAIATGLPSDALAGLANGRDVLAIALEVADAMIAGKQGDLKRAIELLTDAIGKADRLQYDEPPDWWYPVRPILGAVLLAAHRPAEAEKVYQEDLIRTPHNGWSLFGLAQALAAQHKQAAADQATADYEAAFAGADLKLSTTGL